MAKHTEEGPHSLLCVCVRERDEEDCTEKVVPGPRAERLLRVYKRMKEGRVSEVEGTAGAK